MRTHWHENPDLLIERIIREIAVLRFVFDGLDDDEALADAFDSEMLKGFAGLLEAIEEQADDAYSGLLPFMWEHREKRHAAEIEERLANPPAGVREGVFRRGVAAGRAETINRLSEIDADLAAKVREALSEGA